MVVHDFGGPELNPDHYEAWEARWRADIAASESGERFIRVVRDASRALEKLRRVTLGARIDIAGGAFGLPDATTEIAQAFSTLRITELAHARARLARSGELDEWLDGKTRKAYLVSLAFLRGYAGFLSAD